MNLRVGVCAIVFCIACGGDGREHPPEGVSCTSGPGANGATCDPGNVDTCCGYCNSATNTCACVGEGFFCTTNNECCSGECGDYDEEKGIWLCSAGGDVPGDNDYAGWCDRYANAIITIANEQHCQGEGTDVDTFRQQCNDFVNQYVAPASCWDPYRDYLECAIDAGVCNPCQDVYSTFADCFCAAYPDECQ
jgi:hypothetical protein